MRENRTSGSMSGDGKRTLRVQRLAPVLDSTLGKPTVTGLESRAPSSAEIRQVYKWEGEADTSFPSARQSHPPPWRCTTDR